MNMFSKFALLLLTVSLFLSGYAQQSEQVPVAIKAVLVDRDLNQKPVAKAKFTVIPNQSNSADMIDVTTRFDGTAQITLPPGKYRIVSLQPLDFQSKRYSWNVEVAVSTSPISVELSNDNAMISDSPAAVPADDLVSVYKAYRDSIVTVLAEYGPAKGTGFVVDPAGLVLTNQHVVRKSEFVAVQIDPTHRLQATVLMSDSEKDIAVLWADFSKVPEIVAVPLIQKGDEPAIEGEKVFTIGSPLHQRKVMTTGIVSKVEKRAIISDININRGNSGGPLFNSRGVVIGITTFGDTSKNGGPGIAGTIRIEEARGLIAEAKARMTKATKPPADLLPTEPEDTYPLDAIKEAATREKFKADPYIFGVGDYDVAFVTPILRYRHFSSEVRAAQEKQKRERGRRSQSAAQDTFEPLDDLKGWGEYVGEYEPVLIIQASPKMKEGFWSAFGRAYAAQHGYAPGPAKMHFKTDFYKMKLMCGSQEVKPLMPGKAERVIDVNNAALRMTDVTFDGLYVYPFDAVRPECGTVTLQLFSENNPSDPKVKQLEQRTITAVFNDFAPYRTQRLKEASAGSTQ
jgi:S1-C subfamily serine protease